MSKRKKASRKGLSDDSDLLSLDHEMLSASGKKKKRSESMYSMKKDNVLKSLTGKSRKKHSFDNAAFPSHALDALREGYRENRALGRSRTASKRKSDSGSNANSVISVRRNRSWGESLKADFDEDISYDQFGAIAGFTIKGSIKVALKMPSETEQWIKKILLTHKKFDEFESTLLLSELVNVFMEKEEFSRLTKQASVVNIIMYWMKWFPHHFNEELMGDLSLFNDWLCEQSVYAYYQNLLNDSMESIRAPVTEVPIWKDDIERDIEDDIFEYSFREISEQLTLMLHESYSKIDISVYLLDAKIDEQSKFINTISHWVSMECMLYAEKLDDQIDILEYFYNMLQYLYDIQNYGGMFSVYTGLILHEVTRLEGYNSIETKLSSYEKLCTPLNNFRALNYHQDRVEPPFLLHLPAVSHTIIHTNDILQDTISPGIFNLLKMNKYYEIHEKMTLLQSKPYNFKENKEIQNFIRSRFKYAQTESILSQLGLQALI